MRASLTRSTGLTRERWTFEKRPRQRIAGHVSVSVSANENDYDDANDYEARCCALCPAEM